MIAALLLVFGLLGLGFGAGAITMYVTLGGMPAVRRLFDDGPDADPPDAAPALQLVWTAIDAPRPRRIHRHHHRGTAA